MNKIIASIILCCVWPITGWAQDHSADSLLDPGFTVSVRSQLGFLLSHRENMSHLVTGHVKGVEINVDRQTSGLQSWHNSFWRPFVGVGLMQVSLGNPEQLGSATALFGYMVLPLVKREKFLFHYKWGGGIGYVSKPFDRVENYKNTAIGSTFNGYVSVLFETRYKITKHMWLTSGFGFNHWSNSSLAVPNLGINVPTFSVGVQAYFGDVSLNLEKRKVEKLPRDIEFIVFGAFGMREIHPVDGVLFGAVHGFVSAMKRVDNKRKLGVGLDVFYDASNLEEHNRDTSNTFFENGSEFVKVGIHLSHELVFGRFSATTHMGIYLRNNFKSDGSIYHRMSYRYYVSDRFFIDAGFKSHWAVAEHLEMGVGYRFKR